MDKDSLETSLALAEQLLTNQTPVVQTMDSAMHWINHYAADKHSQNQLSYPVDSDLTGE